MSRKKVVKKTVVTTEEIIEQHGEKTQIICILDRSGSMGDIIDDAIGGFNEFLKDQRKLDDKATMTVALFDDRYDLFYDNIDVKEVVDFNRDTWSPRGLTALYDAIGKTINDVKHTHSKMKLEDRPDKILVCIVTDGLENRSQEYRLDNIQKLISNCKEDGWSFIYLAANQDAFDVGTSFGISGGNTFTFTADSNGISNVSATLNSVATYYRSASTGDDNFSTNSDNLIENFSVENEE